MFRDLLNFTTKCIGFMVKSFSFLFFVTIDVKSTKSGELLVCRMIVKQQTKREQTHPVRLNAVKKYEKVESVNTKND